MGRLSTPAPTRLPPLPISTDWARVWRGTNADRRDQGGISGGALFYKAFWGVEGGGGGLQVSPPGCRCESMEHPIAARRCPPPGQPHFDNSFFRRCLLRSRPGTRRHVLQSRVRPRAGAHIVAAAPPPRAACDSVDALVLLLMPGAGAPPFGLSPLPVAQLSSSAPASPPWL